MVEGLTSSSSQTADGVPLPGEDNRRDAATGRDAAGGCGAAVAGKIEEPASAAVQSAAALSAGRLLMRWIEKLSKSDVDRSAQTALADLAAFIAYRASQQSTDEKSPAPKCGA